jgi:hypothetical protein
MFIYRRGDVVVLVGGGGGSDGKSGEEAGERPFDGVPPPLGVAPHVRPSSFVVIVLAMRNSAHSVGR